MKIRNRQSYITTLPEGEPSENNAPKITRWVYFAVLFSIIGYLSYIGYTRITQFQGRGQVEIERTVLSPSHGGKIIDLFISEGELVKQGHTMVRIKSSANCPSKDASQVNRLNLNIALKKSQLRLLNERLSEEKERFSDQEIRRALEINRRPPKGGERAIDELVYKIETLKNEILLGSESLKNINSNSTISSSSCVDEIIYAPFTSVVNSISHKRHEFVKKGEPFISLISRNAQVKIDAYIDNESNQFLSVDKNVEIIFPDKQVGQGIVSEVISSSALFHTKKWRGYESEESSIEIKIVPINASEAQKWKSYDRMEVQIRGLK